MTRNRFSAVASLMLAWSVGAAADPQSPHAGLEERRVKALSPEREKGLAEGAGLGYAMAAELNGHAGPKHVLEVAAELGLTPGQRSQVEASFSRMKSDAVRLGGELLALEEELDRRFAHRQVDEAKLSELTARGSEIEAQLRFVHLRAHLETDTLLSAGQRAKYAELRGYGTVRRTEAAGHEHGG